MQKRVANKLANPDEAYTARCKIGKQEHIIKALPYPLADPDSVWLARKERIVEQTRNQYCKRRDEVDEEIYQRQTQRAPG